MIRKTKFLFIPKPNFREYGYGIAIHEVLNFEIVAKFVNFRKRRNNNLQLILNYYKFNLIRKYLNKTCSFFL